MDHSERKIRNKTGFTLIELIVVIAFLSVLSAILIPVISGYVQRAKAQVCQTNRYEASNLYRTHLLLYDLDHNETTFNAFIADYLICPGGGCITYEDGKVSCSIHVKEATSNESDDEADPGDDVAYLYESSRIDVKAY